jgi:hypothetical protein
MDDGLAYARKNTGNLLTRPIAEGNFPMGIGMWLQNAPRCARMPLGTFAEFAIAKRVFPITLLPKASDTLRSFSPCYGCSPAHAREGRE